MATNSFKVRKSLNIEPLSSPSLTESGDIAVNSSDNELHAYLGGSDRTVVTEDQTQSLTNKTIDADSNTITNIENADIKSGAAIARNKLASGTASHVIINDGSGVMSSEATLAVSRGGTGAATAAAGFDALAPTTTRGDLIARGASSNGRLAVGAANTVLKSDGTDPAWGNVVNANVDASAAIARSKLASGTASHVVINDGSGVMSSEAALAISRGGTGQATATAGFDALSPTTTRGDLITRDGSNNVRLAVGTANQVLRSDGTDASWGTVAIAGGGTGQTSKAAAFDALSPMTTAGDIIIGGASGTGTRLAAGTNGHVLTLSAGSPAWAAPTGVTPSKTVLSVGSGRGSTNTTIRNYTTVTNSGAHLTGAVDATNGASITVNTTGMYSINVTEKRGASACNCGITVNQSGLTTTPDSLTLANGSTGFSVVGATNGDTGSFCRVLYLTATDVVRINENANASDGTEQENNVIMWGPF